MCTVSKAKYALMRHKINITQWAGSKNQSMQHIPDRPRFDEADGLSGMVKKKTSTL